jgi:hypothetical protein
MAGNRLRGRGRGPDVKDENEEGAVAALCFKLGSHNTNSTRQVAAAADAK